MKILSENNNHLVVNKTTKQKYGYVCKVCGTVFVFDESEVSKPRMINPKPRDCIVMCPNKRCKHLISLDRCIKFKNLTDENEFCSKYDE